MKHIVVGLPIYDGKPELIVQHMLQHCMAECRHRGWEYSEIHRPGGAMLPQVRNSIVAEFLAGTGTDLIMVDGDNSCEDGGLVRLAEWMVDVVGAPCRAKSPTVMWPVAWIGDRPNLVAVDPVTGQPSDSGLLEVDRVGTGILRMSRACLERMVEACKDRWYHDLSNVTGRAYPLFEYEVKDHLWWGEDMLFCRHWREIGGRVWIDPSIGTHHIGNMTFSGRIGDWLRDRGPEAQEINLDLLAKTGEAVRALSERMGNVHRAVSAKVIPMRRDLKVSVCIATRGRPELLANTVAMTLSNSVMESTRIVVGFDEDDPALSTAISALASHDKLIACVEAREDSLGEKYNRCQREEPADLYVVCTDDAAITTPGWDRILSEAAKQFPDGIGVINFGSMQVESSLPAMYAITQKFVDKTGFFQVPYFPFWWHDTWTMEIATMINRRWLAQVDVEYPDMDTATKTRCCRDIRFWQMFFDATRGLRQDAARSIILSDEFQTWGGYSKDDLLSQFSIWGKDFFERGVRLRDPAVAEKLEQTVSFDAPGDERYTRIMAEALTILREKTEFGHAA